MKSAVPPFTSRRYRPLYTLIVKTALLTAGGICVRAQTAAEAVNVPSWDLTVPAEENGTGPRMRVVTGPEASDGIAALAGDTGSGENMVLSTMIEGPGKFTWWWKLNGLTNVDRLAVAVFPSTPLPIHTSMGYLPSITGRTGWSAESITLPAGRSIVRWTQRRSPGILRPEKNVAWLDRFSFTPAGPPVSIAEALDNDGLVWVVEGDALWRGVRDGAEQGAPDYAIFGTRLPANSPPNVQLRTALPAGWFSYRWAGEATTTLPQNTDSVYYEQLPDNWRRITGRLPTPGELVFKPQFQGFGSYPEIVLDEFVTRPDNISLSEALDAPWEMGSVCKC